MHYEFRDDSTLSDDELLDGVEPIEGGVPITTVPRADRLADLQGQLGNRNGFLTWASELLARHDVAIDYDVDV